MNWEGSLKSRNSSSNKRSLHESAIFHYTIILLIIATLVISMLAFNDIRDLKASLAPAPIDVNDFLSKLNTHPELQGLETEQPVGGQLDADSLNSLKQQFPDAYANAKVGDFLLRYTTMLIIYDYNADKIVNTINLG